VSVQEIEKTATLEHAGDGHYHGDGILGEQFETLEQQNNAYLIGMWAFIVQEVLFFGAISLHMQFTDLSMYWSSRLPTMN
jgi:heme/copper-type cytochrome/quinol oxidase subunit 3